MNTEVENQASPENRVPEHNLDGKARLIVGISSIIIAVLVVILLVPGFRATIVDWVTTSDEERLKNALQDLKERANGETLTAEAAEEIFLELEVTALTPEQQALLEGELEARSTTR